MKHWKIYQAYFIRLNEAAEDGVSYLHIPSKNNRRSIRNSVIPHFWEIWVFGVLVSRKHLITFYVQSILMQMVIS